MEVDIINNCGIYTIENTVTNKIYIGASTNIHKRWITHKSNYKNIDSKEYYKPLYVDMRFFTIHNFIFKIIEFCDDIYSREKFYIEEYSKSRVLYNKTVGGIGVSNIGSEHGKSKLDEYDVIDIRTRYMNKERKKSVKLDYISKINDSGFNKIWNGYTWKHIMMHVYTDENKAFHISNTANKNSENGRSILKEHDIVFIRTSRKNGVEYDSVYDIYKDKITKGTFKNIWYNIGWQDIKV